MTILGIDLGTTNSALAVADDEDDAARTSSRSRRSSGPARSPSGRRCRRSCSCPASTRSPPAQLQLPWSGAAALRGRHVRARARRRAAASPGVVGEVVAVQPGVDRTRAGPAVPRRAARARARRWQDGERVSPVDASARYLAHLRAAWDDAHPDAPADRAGRAAHRAGVVRRGRARADRASPRARPGSTT